MLDLLLGRMPTFNGMKSGQIRYLRMNIRKSSRHPYKAMGISLNLGIWNFPSIWSLYPLLSISVSCFAILAILPAKFSGGIILQPNAEIQIPTPP